MDTNNSTVGNVLEEQHLAFSQSRIQIDNSILASLITLNQTMGRLQGEIAFLKANGVDIHEIQEQVNSLNKIVITGDSNLESIVFQIRRFRESLEDIKTRVSSLEGHISILQTSSSVLDLESRKIQLDGWWKLIILVATSVTAVVLGWLGIK